ncbi:unnamed protein product, partial [Brenthis ino]
MAHAVNRIPQLESGNFTNWLFRIEIAMDEKGCVDAIRKKTDLKDADLKKSDAKARNIIVQALSDKHLEYVKESRTAHEMIEHLRNVFERKSTISNLYLRRSLINLKCKTHDSVEEHFNKFDKIIREIELNGTKMTEKDKVCQLLISMEGAYPSIVTALETSNMELKIDFVKSKFLDAKLKEKQSSESKVSKQEYVFESNSIKCFSCGEPNHTARNCTNRARTRNPQKRSRGNYRGFKRKEKNNRPRAYLGEENDSEKAISFDIHCFSSLYSSYISK